MLALQGPVGRSSEATFQAICGAGAWRRCAFQDVALVGEVIQLAWRDDAAGVAAQVPDDRAGAGLAFDSGCRLFHAVPDRGLVERVLWGAFDPLLPGKDLPAEPVIGVQPPQAGGDFAPVEPAPAAFQPRALACDDDDRLFILDARGNTIRVFDLTARRLVRSAAAPGRAVDIAWWNGALYGLSVGPAQLWRMSAREGVRVLAAAPFDGLAAPARLAIAPDGRCFVLDRAHEADAAVFELGAPGAWRATPEPVSLGGAVHPFAYASDILAFGAADAPRLVMARRPGETFSTVDIAAAPYGLGEPLIARAYDGMGVAEAPDGRVAFWTAKGVRHAVAARTRYRPAGRVVTFRLDSGAYHNVWGRVLLDACIPSGSAVRVLSVVSDDDDAPYMAHADRMPRTPPAFSDLAPVPEEESTPLPPVVLAPAADEMGPVAFRRTDGSEQPWTPELDSFATYEAEPPRERGRYLWLVVDLQGSSLVTPKVRDIRVESPGHDWLRRLPALYSREERTRAFLQAYLAPVAGLMDDAAAQSDTRNALMKPASAPASVLPWLAGWLGLTLDERWSEAARRTMIREAPALFRARGTVEAVRRMVEIVAEAPAILLEDFRLRGLGEGAGVEPGWSAPSVVGMGLRVGGPVGEAQASVTAAPAELASIFARTAHRFSILIQAHLPPERLAAIRDLLDVHRPAHTLVEVCTGEAGMRIGRGLHVGVSAIIGESGGWRRLQAGASRLGREALVGRPAPGLTVGEGRLGGAVTRIA